MKMRAGMLTADDTIRHERQMWRELFAETVGELKRGRPGIQDDVHHLVVEKGRVATKWTKQKKIWLPKQP